MDRSQMKNDLKLIEINIIVLTILFYLFRTTVPFLKFPFILLLFGFILYSFIRYRIHILSAIKSFFTIFYLSIFLAIILIVSFLLSNKIYLIVFKDVFNIILLVCLLFLMTLYIKSKGDLKIFFITLIRFIIFFALFISVLLLCNFLDLFQADDGVSSDKFTWNLLLASLSTDYNFALLPVFFGLIGVLYLNIEPGTLIKKRIFNFLLIVFSITILLSSSRRGLITLTVIIIILILVQLSAFYRKESTLKNIGSSSKYYLISILIFVFFLWAFAFHASYSFKNKALDFITAKNTASTKVKFALAIYKYASIFDKNNSFSDIYDKIWFHGYDRAKDPNSGWGTRIHRTVFPLTGKNVEIVPPGSKGYLMDSTCNVSNLNGNAYSYTLVRSQKVEQGDSVVASVYCYVSKDFNGGGVKICSDGATYGNVVTEYNVVDSSTNIEYSGENIFRKNRIDDRRKIIKNETKNLFENGDFRKGTQYWIPFADSTQHTVIETPFGKGLRVSRTNGDGGYWSLRYNGRAIVYYAGHRYRFRFNFKIEKGIGIPFLIGWWTNDANQGVNTTRALPLHIQNLESGWKEATCTYKFKETHYDLPTFLNDLQDNSTVDIANVELEDLDRVDSLPSFVDQIVEMEQNKKGVWQKLTLKANCNKGEAPVYLYFSKKGVADFSSLRGYVIFAYPQYKIISKKDGILSSQNAHNKNKTSALITNNLLKSGKNTLLCPAKKDSNRTFFSNMADNDFNAISIPGFQQNTISTSSGTYEYRAGLFPSGLPLLSILFFQDTEKDPIRKWASKLISEDTTYYGYRNELFVDTVSNTLTGDRIMRWQFAWQIFTKEYNWKQKIFGGGFNFLNWFGYRFLKDKTFSDYPHNPFLSILLYSGIFGLLIYLIFFYKVFYYYIKYFREYQIFSVFFIITFFFSFFSAGSPFDPPIMGFFVLLPFFIHYIHQRPEKP